ncbi:hypothetical protein FRC0538_00150 [Corynebacterium diphtheriae]|nr:hypothetical protein FRC0538_00150 [Corynebacterium diphtheriae]
MFMSVPAVRKDSGTSRWLRYGLFLSLLKNDPRVFFNGDEEIGHAKTSNGVAELQTIVPDEAATLQLSAVVEDFENDT